MPDITARTLWDRLNAEGQRDCGRSMVIVEFDEMPRAAKALSLAKEYSKHPSEVYPVRGLWNNA